jgi:hypothetical protein
MLVGTTTTLSSYGAVSGSGDILTPSLALIAPDGTASSPTAEADALRRLSATVEVDQAGVWLATWSAETEYPAEEPEGEEEPGEPTPGPSFLERDMLLATHTDVMAQTRIIMGVSASQLTAQKFDSLVGPMFVCLMECYAAEVPSYAALDGSSAILFDGALAYLAAAFLVSSVSPGANSAQVSSIQTGPDRIMYFKRFAESGKTPDEEWLERAWQLLLCLPGFGDFAELGAGGVFVAAGRRRAIRARLGHAEPAVPLYDIYADVRIGYDFRSDLYVLASA